MSAYQIVGWVLIFFLPVAHADFSILGSKWPDDIPDVYKETVEEQQEQYLGRLSTVEHEKIPRRWTDFMRGELVDELGHYYFKVAGNFAQIKVDKIKNLSSGVFGTSTLSTETLQHDQTGLEAGYGYSWSWLRIDLEYLFNKSTDFERSPLFAEASRSEILISHVKTEALLGNIYYDFREMYLLKPYLGIGGGIAFARTATILNNSSVDGTRKKRKLSLAWAASGGLRLRFWTRFMLNAGYRYARIGKVVWRDNSDALKLKGKTSFSGFVLGFTYLI